MPLEAPKQTSR